LSKNAKGTPRGGPRVRPEPTDDDKSIDERAKEFEEKLYSLGFKRENVPFSEIRKDATALLEQLAGRKTP
jgi:hypothetical protein